MLKEAIPTGTKVTSSTHPAIHGEVIGVREITVLDKTYRIYKVEGSTGSQWVNEIYLRA